MLKEPDYEKFMKKPININKKYSICYDDVALMNPIPYGTSEGKIKAIRSRRYYLRNKAEANKAIIKCECGEDVDNRYLIAHGHTQNHKDKINK